MIWPLFPSPTQPIYPTSTKKKKKRGHAITYIDWRFSTHDLSRFPQANLVTFLIQCLSYYYAGE